MTTREVPLSNMAADAYRAATGADVAIESVQLSGDGVQAGPLSTMQLMNIAPHIYHPVTGQTFPQNGKLLDAQETLGDRHQLARSAQSEFFSPTSLGLIGWMSQSGAYITWSPNGGASELQSIQILNPVTGAYEPLDNAKTYVVTFHDGILEALQILVSELSLNVDPEPDH